MKHLLIATFLLLTAAPAMAGNITDKVSPGIPGMIHQNLPKGPHQITCFGPEKTNGELKLQVTDKIWGDDYIFDNPILGKGPSGGVAMARKPWKYYRIIVTGNDAMTCTII